MPYVIWSECSGTTIFVRVIRLHCIDRFECLLNYLRLSAYVIINADEIIGLQV